MTRRGRRRRDRLRRRPLRPPRRKRPCDPCGHAARRENFFRGAGAERAFAHADDGQPRLLAHAVPHRQHGGRAGDGEIAEAAGELHERRAGAGRRTRVAQLHHHLARLQRRRHHAGEELFRGQLAAAGAARDHHRAIQRHQHAGMFRRRIVVRDAAANGAAVADRRVRDLRGRLGQQWPALAHMGIAQQVGVPNQRTDGQAVRSDMQAIQRLDAIDVDQYGGAEDAAD